MITYNIWKTICHIEEYSWNAKIKDYWDFSYANITFCTFLSILSIPVDILASPIYLIAGIIYEIIKIMK